MSTNVYGTKYNPMDPQIKTWSVQRTLDPLVAQVCNYLNINIDRINYSFMKVFMCS